MDKPESLEIDLGKYLEILLRQWALLLGAAIICALAAAAFVIRTPVGYQARVLVATTKIASSVTFGSSIETLSEGQLPVTLVDRKARLQSYVALVSNPVIAERVYEELKDDFGDRLPAPESLIKMVSGSVLTGSDAVEIKVSNTDPVMVQRIADAWGRHYVDYVNKLYAMGSSQETLANVQKQVSEAHVKFLKAEQDYITFLVSSPLEEFNRIREELIRVDRLRADAHGLLEHVKMGGEGAAASNAPAVSILKTQVFSSSTGADKTQPGSSTSPIQSNPISLQFQANPLLASQQDLIADIDSLVNTLDNRIQILTERVDYLVLQQQSQPGSASTEAIQQVENPRISVAEDVIRILASKIEQEEGRRKDLALSRDLSWNSYQNLATKEAELMIASQTGGQEVVLGSTAYVSRNGSSLIRNVALAGLVGMMLGIFMAFFIEYWWGYKGREPHAILGWNFGGRGEKAS
jgi:polysaccharide biosynthesis transport protein